MSLNEFIMIIAIILGILIMIYLWFNSKKNNAINQLEDMLIKVVKDMENNDGNNKR